MSILLLSYYILVSIGVFHASARLLKTLYPALGALPAPTLYIMAGGLFPAALSYIAFLNVFRVPFSLVVVGLIAAVYGAHTLYHARAAIGAWLRGLGRRDYLLPRILIAILAITFLVTQHCYLDGGVNNFPWDQIRGLSFTSGLAANFLKPAHPMDMAVPLSYSYYSYSYTAFLYSAVNGTSWPSITLMLLAGLSITLFYYAFVQFCAIFTPSVSRPVLTILAIMMISFYGLDVFISPHLWRDQHIDWWNLTQITQMASLWHWVYHYLLAAAFSLLAVVELRRGLIEKNGAAFCAGIVLIALAPTYAVMTGIFLAVVTAFALLHYVLASQPRGALLIWTFKEAKIHALFLFPALLLVLLPQAFTFIGRESFASLESPHLWMIGSGLFTSSYQDYFQFVRTLFFELGPMMFYGLILLPWMVWKLRSNERFGATYMGYVLLMSFVFTCFVQAEKPDWYWRTGGFGIVIAASSAIIWWSTTLFRPQRLVDKCICALLFLFALSSGIYNFYTEQYFRYKGCNAPPAMLADLNRAVPLHTAIAFTTFNPSLTYIAGRVPIGLFNPAWHDLKVYNLSDRKLVKWFGDKNTGEACRKTWYGSTFPTNDYVKMLEHMPIIKLEHYTCK